MVLTGMLVAGTLLAGTACTASPSLANTGTVTLPSMTTGSAGPSAAAGPVLATPVTANGLLSGPGVSETAIALGLLTTSAPDGGFAAGFRLWAQAVNADAGICGRTIAVSEVPAGAVPASDADDPAADDPLLIGYRELAPRVVGFAAPAAAAGSGVTAASRADEIAVLLPTGPSSILGATGPLPVGATTDVLAINALGYLRTKGGLPRGSRVGVLTSGSADSANALAGARWWAARNEIEVDSHGSAGADWSGDAAVLSFGPASSASAVLAASGNVPVVVGASGYDPAQWQAADSGRLLLSLPTPAFGSDHPASAAVAGAYARSGGRDPGPLLLAGYAVGNEWGRLLENACGQLNLSRNGIAAAISGVGPAAVDSLVGPTDLSQAALHDLPATRVSAMAEADPSAPGGLRPLTWLQATPGIADYRP